MADSPTKRPAFAIVRVDGDARQLEQHLIVVKAVYDDQEAALQEVDRLRTLNEGVTYVVLPTRHIVSETRAATIETPKRSSPITPNDATVASALEALRSARNLVAHTGNRAALFPLAAEFAELLVRKTLRAVPVERNQAWDLIVGDKRIEVKAAIEDPAHRSPTLHFSSLDFDELAVVQFDAELEPTGVFRVGAEEVKQHARSGGRHRFVLRLTPEFLRLHAVRLA